MHRSSAVLTAFALASCLKSVAADAGCSSVLATANEAGLGALTATLTTATTDLLASEIGTLVVSAASIEFDLPEGQRVTIFAPTDVAFQEAAEKFGGTLPEAALADVLLNHVVPQELTSEAIIALLGEGGGSVVVPTALGSELFVSTDGAGIFVQSAGLEAPGATVIIPDQITCAGPVHVIDTVLLPTLPDGSVVPFPDAAAPEAEAPVVDDVPLAAAPETMMPDTALEPLVLDYESPVGLMPAPFAVLPYDYADEPMASEPIIALLGDEPSVAPLGDEPLIAPLGDEPSMAPLGDEPLIATLGDEPSTAPLGDEPLVAPLGDEPAFAPMVDDRSIGPLGDVPMDAPLGGEPALPPGDDLAALTPEGSEGDLEALTPEGAEGDLEASEGGSESAAPAVQGESGSAFSPAALSSTVAAVAAAAFVLVA